MESTQTNPYPFSREAEEAVVGGILISPHLFPTIDIKPADFFIQRLGAIWKTFQKLADKDKPIDFLTVLEQLKADRILEKVGGSSYLTTLTNQPPNSLNVDHYADIVRQYAQRRGLIKIASEMAIIANDTSNDIQLEQSKFPEMIAKNVRLTSESVSVADWMSKGFDSISIAYNDPDKVTRVKTGFIDCDRIFGDLTPGVFIITGKPGMGKTIWVTDIVLNNVLSEQQTPGAFYSSEMSQDDMTMRIYSRQTDIAVSQLRHGKFEADKWQPITQTLAEFSELPLFVSDATNWTIPTLRADLTRLKYEYDIQFFALDYLELLLDRPDMDDYQRSNFIGRGLQRICRDLELVGFVVQKLNKSGFSGVPDLQDLSGGSGLAYDAPNVVMMMEFIPEQGQPKQSNLRTCIVRKGRYLEGNKRRFEIGKFGHKPQFHDIEINKPDYVPNGFTHSDRDYNPGYKD